jgi:hypothetical protein
MASRLGKNIGPTRKRLQTRGGWDKLYLLAIPEARATGR